MSDRVSMHQVGEGELGSYFGCTLAMPELSTEQWSRCTEEFVRFNRQGYVEEELMDEANKYPTSFSTLVGNEKVSMSLTSARVHSEIMYD